VDGFQPFSPATMRRWKKSVQRWRTRREMRSRGWNDRDTLH
jgi:ribosomal protein S21